MWMQSFVDICIWVLHAFETHTQKRSKTHQNANDDDYRYGSPTGDFYFPFSAFLYFRIFCSTRVTVSKVLTKDFLKNEPPIFDPFSFAKMLGKSPGFTLWKHFFVHLEFMTWRKQYWYFWPSVLRSLVFRTVKPHSCLYDSTEGTQVLLCFL